MLADDESLCMVEEFSFIKLSGRSTTSLAINNYLFSRRRCVIANYCNNIIYNCCGQIGLCETANKTRAQFHTR